KENQSLKVKAKGISAMKFSLSIFDYTFTNYYYRSHLPYLQYAQTHRPPVGTSFGTSNNFNSSSLRFPLFRSTVLNTKDIKPCMVSSQVVATIR
ncbi:MAG: hypothetical protein RLP02_35780, partial [Coleofasciculus sp. C2-GNP5-27]